MFVNLYIINIRKIFKAMQLFKLNALTLLLITNKKYECYVIIKNFENREFYYSKIMMSDGCDN